MKETRMLKLQLLLLLLFFRCCYGLENPEDGRQRESRQMKEKCYQSVTVRGSGGTLTSPNYPNHYPNSTDCRWLLTAEHPNETLLLKINALDIEPDTDCKLESNNYPNSTDCRGLLTAEHLLHHIPSCSRLDIEPDTDCELDYLQVYLGSNALAPPLGPFCGSVRNRLFKTNSSRLMVVFHSDPLYEDKGFSLDYFTQTTDCPSVLTEESGALRSPGYPATYPDNTDCWTQVIVGENKKIILTFDSIDMEYGDNCTFDYVQIFDGGTRNSSLVGQLCTHTSDATSFESSSNTLLIHFHSDNSVGKQGYRATYTSVDKRTSPLGECQWDSAEENGTIASPNHPSNYPSLSNCSLWILAPRGTRVLISFDALQLEMEPGCPFDFLQIEETSSSANKSKVLGRFCGNEGEPTNLTSTQNEVHIRFQSDDFGEFSGFKLHYQFLNKDGTVKKQKIVSGEPSPSKLVFSVVPQNATLDVGASHRLHCGTQYPGAKIQWWKGDTFLAGGSPLAGLKVLPNNTLWIPSMTHTLSGIYTCVALSSDSRTTATTQAYVLVKNSANDDTCGIVFRKTPKDSSFAEGEFAHLECVAAGAHVQMSWEKNGRPLQLRDHITVLRNGYIFVDKVRLEDAGVYTCVARDVTVGCEKKVSALLQVNQRIKVEEICGIPRVNEPSQDTPQVEHGKIIGGHNARKGAYPWQVMLWEPNLKSFCGGTVLNERWIATAAHCFVNYKNLRWDRVLLKFGKHDREREEEVEFRTGIADASSIVVHPAYKKKTFDNDLALVRLRDHLQFSDYILPACLGEKNFSEFLLGGGSSHVRMGTVVGWGKLKDNGPSPRFLQEIRLPVVDQGLCMQSTNYTVTRNMFCAGYSQEIIGDACHGDSGGPFLMAQGGRWYLVGVVSWGEGCGTENKYGFYTRVSNYVDWIRGIIRS